jgi:RNA polymerase sigma factor (sigma-70 family)
MGFEEIYSKYYHELRRFAQRLNISSDKCEDLIQETFLKFYLEVEKNVVFVNPRAWLYKVFLNLFKSEVSAKKEEPAESAVLNRNNEEVFDSQEEFFKNEKQRIVMEILEKLPTKDKEILLLYKNGFSYAEMAEILELNPKSIGTTLVRAIERLKVSLKNQYHEMFE